MLNVPTPWQTWCLNIPFMFLHFPEKNQDIPVLITSLFLGSLVLLPLRREQSSGPPRGEGKAPWSSFVVVWLPTGTRGALEVR